MSNTFKYIVIGLKLYALVYHIVKMPRYQNISIKIYNFFFFIFFAVELVYNAMGYFFKRHCLWQDEKTRLSLKRQDFNIFDSFIIFLCMSFKTADTNKGCFVFTGTQITNEILHLARVCKDDLTITRCDVSLTLTASRLKVETKYIGRCKPASHSSQHPWILFVCQNRHTLYYQRLD